ncbi:MAG: hypothetical protein IBJ00_03775 [Alphaproteobacteria bacterium]|nr:hypothetical protein [Alphaproteobacteria bacterium]
MMKIKTTLSVLISIIPFISETYSSESSLNGFSFLGRGGFTNAVGKLNHFAVPAVKDKKDSSNISLEGPILGPALLYTHTFKNLIHTGIEIDSIWVRGTAKTNLGGVTAGEPLRTAFKIKRSYGTSLRFGYLYKGGLPYLKLGVLQCRITSVTESLPLSGSNNKAKYLNGFLAGLGVDVPLNEKLSLGGEFSRVQYKKLSYNVQDAHNTPALNVKARIHENRFTIHFKFKLFNDFIK